MFTILQAAFNHFRPQLDYIRCSVNHPTDHPPPENKLAYRLWSSAQTQLQLSRKFEDQYGDHPVMKILSATGTITETLSRCVYVGHLVLKETLGSNNRSNLQMTTQLQALDVQSKAGYGVFNKSEKEASELIKQLEALSAEAAAHGLSISEFIEALIQQTSQMEHMEKTLAGILQSKPMTDKLDQLLKWDAQLAEMQSECDGLQQELASVEAEMSKVADSVEGLASLYKNVLAQKHKTKDDIGNIY